MAPHTLPESANPFTGSWDGSKPYYQANIIFIHNIINLIITGLVGLRPKIDDFV